VFALRVELAIASDLLEPSKMSLSMPRPESAEFPLRVEGVHRYRTGSSNHSSSNRSSTPRRYRQGTQGVSNRSNVFMMALRFAAFACGQNFGVESLYSTWNTALFALAK
jgi:hypothetical protein